MSDTAEEFHLTITSREQNAVDLLSVAAKLSHHEIKLAMTKGCVWHTRKRHTQRLRRSKKVLQAGDEIHMYHNPRVLSQTVTPATLIADEGDYSIWFKPYGMLCQGSKWSDHTTINRFVETNLLPQRPAFVVHRLDRATTGLLVIAHAKSAARALSSAFEQRNTKKVYQAIVHGKFNAIDNSQTVQTINTDIDGKTAVSHVSLLSYDQSHDRSLVEVNIDTGRKHQIRIHLAAIGLPIVGDRMHGIKEKDDSEDLQLCAVALTIPCPHTGQSKEYLLTDELQLSHKFS
ncbi:RluA family pseudouridine synthase [Thalassotalea sp. ND16A]|uniref:RluA family pseudouridine synthase n=1 Tax=Thalassotalea sp. ND16A TaxID=1535422 RepID=UPI00051A0110|nr:RNA pseudouridine synthase [Thalassotalea sp. ND16A]KGJ99153.1 hypothetical protein ND16A_3917 [Thalassotalea sp. ND16A]